MRYWIWLALIGWPLTTWAAPQVVSGGIDAERAWQGIPGLERTPGGRLFVSWYSGGEREPAPENEVYLVHSDDGGKSFSPIQVIAEPQDGARAFDPALWIDPRGRLWYLFNRGDRTAPRHQVVARICEQPDAPTPVFGPEQVIDLGVPYAFRINKPTVLTTGEWLLPVTHAAESPRDWFARERQRQGVAISTDEGKTWKLHGSLEAPYWALECMVTELRDGRIWLLTRTGSGYLWESYSSDRGRTWSAPQASTIASPGARFFIRRLASGKLLLVNHFRFTKRSHLTAQLSSDEGKSWSEGLLLDAREGVSYPDGVQDAEGNVWIAYDFDRKGLGEVLLARFREEDVVAGKLVTPGAAIRQVVHRLREPDAGIEWLLHYEARALPTAPWRPLGEPVASVEGGHLTLADESATAPAAYEAEWSGDLTDREIVVDARLRVRSMVANRGSPVATWPQRDGAPITVEVCDGRHIEGILLTPPAHLHPGAAPGYVRTLTDRFHQADTVSEFHTYRLVIRDTDMAIEMDGRRIIEGRNAFARPAPSGRRTLRFGSTAPAFTSASQWEFVRLGLRPTTGEARPPSRLEITIGEPFDMTAERNGETRPYLYNVGRGLLLLSTPQGSDALLEPYGVRRSTDGGRTWALIPGLDQNVESPQSLTRLADGSILGPSRWTWLQPDGILRGKTTRLDAEALTWSAIDSTIELPESFKPQRSGEVFICERQVWAEPDGSLLAAGWSRLFSIRLPNGRGFPERHTHLLRSTDQGGTWKHWAHVGLGGEPALARLSEQEWVAIARPDAHMSNLVQHRSLDGGRTWKQEKVLEEGSVDPDLELMSHGVLACSYGRPASCLMFSLDGGRTWTDHRVVADRTGFNYTSIREVSPGRLLYMHDAQRPGGSSRINGVMIDVRRVDVPQGG